jgi:hypothetical protein
MYEAFLDEIYEVLYSMLFSELRAGILVTSNDERPGKLINNYSCFNGK